MSYTIIGLVFIFLARVTDVSIGTFRIILVARGYRHIAPVLGFFEVLIWITAIGHVMQNLNSVWSYIAYASGFATGTFVGMKLESIISIGYQSIRIIPTEKVTALPMMLREEGFGITTVDGKGMKSDVVIIYTTVPKSRVNELLDLVETFEPNAFITIEDVRSHKFGYMAQPGYSTSIGKEIAKKK
jgi:uncharacterized protein YebE (UPF0316 family)